MGFKDSFEKVRGTVVDKVEGAVDTVTGKAVLQKVAEYAQETDAINTAIVTRIYEIIEQHSLLKTRHEKTRNLVVMCLVLNGVLVCAVIALYARWR